MAKKILLVEDNGSLSYELKEKIDNLEGGGKYFAEIAYSYIAAFGIWEEDNGNFDCIVLDLQINPAGLTIEEVEAYQPVFGIAFLNKICEGKTPEERADIYKKTVIYSGFTRELDVWKKHNHALSLHLKNITETAKRRFGIPDLLNTITKICER